MEDDDWWQTGPPEMYAPPTPPRGWPSPRRVNATPLTGGPVVEMELETWESYYRGEDHWPSRCQFITVVRDQPDIPNACVDGITSHDHTWYYKDGKRQFYYYLQSGCRKFKELPEDERQRRTPTLTGSLNEPCSQCPFVE